MKLYAYCLVFLLAFSVSAQSTIKEQSPISYEISAGIDHSLTKLPYLDAALQRGHGVQASILLDTVDSTRIRATGRILFDYFRLESSAPQSDGNLYRAWQGFGAGLLGGIRLPVLEVLNDTTEIYAHLEAGASLSATKYTGTGLVSANPSMLARMGLDASLYKRMRIGIAIPLELAFKSGGTALMCGLVFYLRYR